MDASTPKPISALSATPQSVKGSAGALCWYDIYNPNAAVAYVQLIDKASPTVGTDAAAVLIGVPASGRAQGYVNRAAFQNAISAAATTGPANNTAPTSPLVATFGIR